MQQRALRTLSLVCVRHDHEAVAGVSNVSCFDEFGSTSAGHLLLVQLNHGSPNPPRLSLTLHPRLLSFIAATSDSLYFIYTVSSGPPPPDVRPSPILPPSRAFQHSRLLSVACPTDLRRP